MDRDAGVEMAAAALHRRALHRDDVGGRRREASLVVAQRGLRKPGAFVEHRQQRQAEPGGLGRIRKRPRQRHRIGVARAVEVVLQIVELADLGVAAAQQLDIELRRDGAQLLGRDAQRDAVHAVAPRPEVVLARLAPLGQARHRALEGVAVGIDEGRDHGAVEPRADLGRGDAGADVVPASRCVTGQQHVLVPRAG